MKKTRMLVLVLMLAGCGSVPAAWLDASEKTYKVIAPEYEAYVDKDETLDEDDKEDRRALLRAWRWDIDTQRGEAAQ